MVTALSGTAHAIDETATNDYGSSHLVTDRDELSVCDRLTDGVKVRASIQKSYGETSSWQAIGTIDAPASAYDTKVIDVDPDSSLIRIHILGGRDGNKVSSSDNYSVEFAASP